jgi:hypothetical protein
MRVTAADWRKARTCVRLEEITPRMLTPARESADLYGLPQTIFPAKWYGPDYMGLDCLLTYMAAVMWDGWGPGKIGAIGADNGTPLLTVLPATYYLERTGHAEAPA